MFEKSLMKFGVDFENEHFVNLASIDHALHYAKQMVPEMSDFFL